MRGRSVGFVPTMGALHEGHMSLVKRSRHENDINVVSIFVNPTQFGPSEDLEKYPRDIAGDIRKLRETEVDILFLPEPQFIYPEGFSTSVTVNGISEKLCGRFRPGHFAGVATVVTKLLNIVRSTRAYFGQKDFQQTAVIKQMARDLNMDVQIVACPTVREQDGLAMSSRNVYLDKERRKAATVLFQTLHEASEMIRSGGKASAVRDAMARRLAGEPLITKVDYASLYDPGTLDEIGEMGGEVLVAGAIRLDETRLIDNVLVRP